VEDNDLNEIAEDNAGHFDQADPDDAIPVAAEPGNQAGEESVSEPSEMLPVRAQRCNFIDVEGTFLNDGLSGSPWASPTASPNPAR
jgi:hypothetical protein